MSAVQSTIDKVIYVYTNIQMIGRVYLGLLPRSLHGDNPNKARNLNKLTNLIFQSTFNNFSWDTVVTRKTYTKY